MTFHNLYHWVRLISFKIFLISFIVTLVGLSFLGRVYSQQNPYVQFERFHQLLSLESVYYPTISQLKAVAKEKLQNRKKIGVIVGGTSVFNGVGQGSKDLWTKQLQKLLKDDYEVINLAFRAGLTQGGGSLVAQSLLDEGYKIIFVVDMPLHNLIVPIDGGPTFNYLFWDAYYKGILKSYSKTFWQEMHMTEQNQGDNIELKLRMWLDSILYFNDFWTTIGYKYFFTVWNQFVVSANPASNFTQARVQTTDPDAHFVAAPTAQRYQIPNDVLKREQEVIQVTCASLIDKWNKLIPASWERFDQTIKAFFPEKFRSHLLLVPLYRSRYYFDTVKSSYRDCWIRGNAEIVKRSRKAGYWAVDVEKDFLAEDFNDGIHLVASGGFKMAEALAPKIQQIASSLGYLK